MKVYDGRDDKKAFLTKRTVSIISVGEISHSCNDCMTLRINGRKDWSLFYCEKGKIFFEDKIVNNGYIWIYPPNVPQKYTIYKSDKTVYRYLHFVGSEMYELLTSLEIDFCSPIKVDGLIISEIFKNLQDSVTQQSVLSTLVAEDFALRLISKIAIVRDRKNENHFLKRVTDHMEHYFVSEYDLKFYADMLCISVSRFNHLFKECIGISPYSYYVNIRINNACALLEHTDLKIKDIAEKCGYEDAFYFARVFKKNIGQTPSEYRKLNKIE